jgi:hypothetical protein
MKQQEMVRTIFVIQPQSIIDVITNSSSELFIFSGKEKAIIEEMITAIYPNYLDEYEELVSLDELDNDGLDTYLSYNYYDYKDDLILSKTFNIAPEILYSNWNKKETAKYWYGELSEEGIALIKTKLKEQGTMYFLFSLESNPNWEMQEQLENIGYRIHLG